MAENGNEKDGDTLENINSGTMENNDRIDKSLLDKLVLYGVSPSLLSSYMILVNERDQYGAGDAIQDNSDTVQDNSDTIQDNSDTDMDNTSVEELRYEKNEKYCDSDSMAYNHSEKDTDNIENNLKKKDDVHEKMKDNICKKYINFDTMEDISSENDGVSDTLKKNVRGTGIDKTLLDNFISCGVNPALLRSYMGLVIDKDQNADEVVQDNSDTNEVNKSEKELDNDNNIRYEKSEKCSDSESMVSNIRDDNITKEDNPDTVEYIDSEKAAAVDDMDGNNSDKSCANGGMDNNDKDTAIDKTLLDKFVLYGINPTLISNYMGLVGNRDGNIIEDNGIEIDGDGVTLDSNDMKCCSVDTLYTIDSAGEDNAKEDADDTVENNDSKKYCTFATMNVIHSEKDSAGDTKKDKNSKAYGAHDTVRDNDRENIGSVDTLKDNDRDKNCGGDTGDNVVDDNKEKEDADDFLEINERKLDGAGYLLGKNTSEKYDTCEDNNSTTDGGAYDEEDNTSVRVAADDSYVENNNYKVCAEAETHSKYSAGDTVKYNDSDTFGASDSTEVNNGEKEGPGDSIKDIISEKQYAGDTVGYNYNSIFGAGDNNYDYNSHQADDNDSMEYNNNEKYCVIHTLEDNHSEEDCDGDNMEDNNDKKEGYDDTFLNDDIEEDVDGDMIDQKNKEKSCTCDSMEDDYKAKVGASDTLDDNNITKNLAVDTHNDNDEVYADDIMTMEANNSKTKGVVNTLDETKTLDENNIEKESFQNCDDEKGCLDMEQFKILETIGKGGYARVCLCLHEPSAQYFALKMLSSDGVARAKQVEHVQCEMDILQEISHPFLIPLLHTSKEGSRPLLLFPYISGGKLNSHLKKARKFSTSAALFFSAEIVSALSYLHSLGIVHRDLKPENILLDKEGHVVIVDFGFSKKITERSSTMCGTQKYLAPEIIECTGHDKAVDWWALGILIYEMLVGYPPFFDDNPFLTSQKILTEKIKWPRKMDASAKDLIEKLLERDKAKRLGSSINGAEDVKNHNFFTALDWEDVYHKGLKPPIAPEEGKPDKTQEILKKN